MNDAPARKGLALEALAVGERIANPGREQLEGDLAMDRDVLGAVDAAHTAAPDELFDAIATIDKLADERIIICRGHCA